MQLSLNAIALIKHILMYDGKKEWIKDAQGKEVEVNSARKLDPIEAVQRRHFIKNTDAVIAEAQAKVQTEVDKAGYKELYEKKKEEYEKAKVENVEKALEKDVELNALLVEINKFVKTINDDKHEVRVEDSTKKVIKKCYDAFGKEVGYGPNDDDIVVELEEVLK